MSVAWGILSTARINRPVLAGARGSTEVDVVAVASRDGARAESYAREHGIERSYGSYEALLADPDVEAVYVSLPNALHVPWTIRALEAGKHVFCEKPLTSRAHEAEAAFDAADRAGRILSEAFMYRHHPQTARFAELVREGAIGRLQLVRATFAFRLSDRGNVRLLPDLAGGSLHDVGCYCVSGARLLAGEPERAYGEAVTGETGVDVRFTGMLRFPAGVQAELSCGFTIEHQGLEAIGDGGSLLAPDPWHCRLGVLELRRAGEDVERIHVEPADSYRLELEDVSRAIRAGSQPLLGREDALGQARVLEALLRSAADGVPVEVEGTGG